MTEARDLLKCERCVVYLVDPECCEAVSIILKIVKLILKSNMNIIYLKHYGS